MRKATFHLRRVQGLPAKALQLQVQQLDRDHMDRPYSAQAWAQTWRSIRHYQLFTLELNQEGLPGGLLLFAMHASPQAHLLKFLIQPRHRGQGLAPKVLGQALKDLTSQGIESVYLEVDEANGAAIAVYQKLGFQTLHRAKNFYSDGAAGLKMLKNASFLAQ